MSYLFIRERQTEKNTEIDNQYFPSSFAIISFSCTIDALISLKQQEPILATLEVMSPEEAQNHDRLTGGCCEFDLPQNQGRHLNHHTTRYARYLRSSFRPLPRISEHRRLSTFMSQQRQQQQLQEDQSYRRSEVSKMFNNLYKLTKARASHSRMKSAQHNFNNSSRIDKMSNVDNGTHSATVGRTKAAAWLLLVLFQLLIWSTITTNPTTATSVASGGTIDFNSSPSGKFLLAFQSKSQSQLKARISI